MVVEDLSYLATTHTAEFFKAVTQLSDMSGMYVNNLERVAFA